MDLYALAFITIYQVISQVFCILLLQLVLANPGPVVVDKFHASKFPEMIGEDRIFLTVADAVLTCAPKIELEP